MASLTLSMLPRVLGLSALPRAMRVLLVTVIGGGAVALVWISVVPPPTIDWFRIAFWVVLTLVSAALPVKLPGGVVAHTTTTPIFGAVFDSALPNPFAVSWIALIGTTEVRDLRRELAWYGTLYNRSAYLLSALAAWTGAELVRAAAEPVGPGAVLVRLFVAGAAFSLVNVSLAVLAASIRTGQPLRRVWALNIGDTLPSLVAQVALGWLMAQVAVALGLWAAFMVMIPLQLARYSLTKYTEVREMFFGSVSALSQAIDAKDGFTRGHADRVSRIAGAIAREIGGLSEKEIEQIELAGMLHDIGKIGVEDRILMKPTRLDDEERERMKLHTVYGASILEPSSALRPLVPIVLHHHENYDGSGYPEGLKGAEIPLGSRILIVADAYEAMTSDRVYRKAIGHERAMEQLNKYKGGQFDPGVVRALDQLLRKRGPAAFEVSDLPPINYETLADVRKRLHRPASGPAHAD